MDMENRTVESITESKADVQANLGMLSQKDKEVVKSHSTQKVDENEEMETSISDEDADDVMDDEVTEDDGSKDEQAKKGKKQGGFQKKINKLTGRALTAEQERDFWKDEALKAKGTPKEEPKAAKVNESSEPNPNDFDSHAEYVKAITKHEIAAQREFDATEKTKENAKSEAQAKVQTLQSKVNEFAKTKEDYHDVVSDVDDIEVQRGLINLIAESNNAPLLSYELAKNRVELERINSLPPREAAIELFRFEAKLQSSSENNTETKTVKTTQAVRPLKPVGSASKASINDSPYEKEQSYPEYKEWQAKQKK